MIYGLYSANSLKQQPTDRDIAPFGHIILISSKRVFEYQLYIVFGFTLQRIEPPRFLYTWGEYPNHYFIQGSFTLQRIEPPRIPTLDASTLTITQVRRCEEH